MDERDIESIIWDCVTEPTDDNSHLGYQTEGITKLAVLIAEQDRKIAALEARVTALSADRTTEK